MRTFSSNRLPARIGEPTKISRERSEKDIDHNSVTNPKEKGPRFPATP